MHPFVHPPSTLHPSIHHSSIHHPPSIYPSIPPSAIHPYPSIIHHHPSIHHPPSRYHPSTRGSVRKGISSRTCGRARPADAQRRRREPHIRQTPAGRVLRAGRANTRVSGRKAVPAPQPGNTCVDRGLRGFGNLHVSEEPGQRRGPGPAGKSGGPRRQRPSPRTSEVATGRTGLGGPCENQVRGPPRLSPIKHAHGPIPAGCEFLAVGFAAQRGPARSVCQQDTGLLQLTGETDPQPPPEATARLAPSHTWGVSSGPCGRHSSRMRHGGGGGVAAGPMETRLQPLHPRPEPGSASRGGDFPTGRRPGSRRPQGWLPRGLSRWPASPRAPGHPSVRLCPSRPFSRGHGSRGTSAHPSDLPTTFLKGLRPNPVTLGGRSGLHHRNSERGHSPP